MTLPNPLNVSTPTVGTTTHALAKAQDGVYQLISGVDFIMQAKLYPANPVAKSSQGRVYMAKDYSRLDLFPASPSGKMSGNFSFSFTPGTDITNADVITFIQQFGSVLAQSAVATALVEGSLE